MALLHTSLKTNRVLQVILIAFLVIVFRIWHLGVIQRQEKLLEAQKPQQRTLLLRADRGIICDRFHIPLALNRICYNAAIYYSQIAQVPTVSWQTDEKGNRVRVYERKEYIRNLSQTLSKILDLDAGRIEDLIHSKAALFPHVPYVLKSGLTEQEHYQLRTLERDWLGIHAEIAAERFYPLGKTAAGLIGSMGAINQKEYSAIAQEISSLQDWIYLYEQGIEEPIPSGCASFEEARHRLCELKEKAYTINDLVGKTGVEAQFEKELRGSFGKKTFEIDQKGRSLKELDGSREATGGQQIILSISAELQLFAEQLLAQDEKLREGRSIGLDPSDQKRKVQKQPWIKGGAIVAFDPRTGEVLALASHPRFDPNDFIPSAHPLLKPEKQKKVCRWLENERFIGAVWDGKEYLTRERYGSSPRRFFEERQPLTWEFYLDSILPSEGSLRSFFQRVDDIKSAVQIQEDFEELLYFSKISDPRTLIDSLFPPDSSKQPRLAIPEAAAAQRRLETLLSPIAANSDKLFAIDLCRTAVYNSAFSDALLAQLGSLKLSAYRALTQAFFRAETQVRKEAQDRFHREEFQLWRNEHQKEFLATKRKEEKEKKTYARPYVDYIDQKERELFSAFWEEKKFPLLLTAIAAGSEEPELKEICQKIPSPLSEELLRTFRPFSKLDRPLLGYYRRLRHKKNEQTEKDLAAAFYPIEGFGFSRSFAFQSGSPQGSLFKLVTAYEGLRQGCFLTLIDEIGQDPKISQEKGQIVAYALNRAPYPRYYRGGRLPKSAHPQIGKIDLVGALEQSSNPYFAILAGDYFEDPEDLARAAILFGFGEKTGVCLPGETKGNVPLDLKTNRTGLYSTAMGHHTLLVTPLQSAVMLAALANGGKLLKPQILKTEEPSLKRSIPLSSQIRSLLFEGMDRAVWGAKGSARPTVIKGLLSNPLLMREMLSLQHQMLGKTSTAEIVFNPYIHPSSQPQIYKHIWFGAVSFPSDGRQNRWEDAEICVVVFLRYGDGGKEAAPLAAQVIRKWREIKTKACSAS